MKKIFDFERASTSMRLNCALVQVKKFKKNEVITTYLVKRKQICLLLSGEAYLTRYTDQGERRIIYLLNKGDTFGEVFYRLNTNRELFVVAKKDCEVLFFPFDKIDNCPKDCQYHVQLLRILPELFINRIADLNFRTEMLTHKGIRDKLMSYFQSLSLQNRNNKEFELTCSFTDLADYLVLDRSAMMRELSKMIDEGVIKKVGRKITILKG